MKWQLWRWWRRPPNGEQARAAVAQASQQQAEVDQLAESIERVAGRVERVRRTSDMLAREVTRALGAR